MKIRVSVSEVYPVFGEVCFENAYREVEINGNLWEDYLKAKGEFYDLLEQVEEVVDKQRRTKQ